MASTAATLVCFAVKEEAAHFRRLAGAHPGIGILLTGMGRLNAEKAIAAAFADGLPERVITAGFAGGLIPELLAGTVMFSADQETGLESALRAAGARPTRFHCVDKVAPTALEKHALHANTGAEAVEMESEFIRALCSERGIPAATVRVVLDPVGEDLALDFNRLMTPDQRIDNRKLALELLKSPMKIGALLRLQKQSATAATRLGEVLGRVLKVE
jgi:nucleoside phosphorylase